MIEKLQVSAVNFEISNLKVLDEIKLTNPTLGMSEPVKVIKISDFINYP